MKVKFKSSTAYYKEDWDEPISDWEACCEFAHLYVNNIVIPAISKKLVKEIQQLKHNAHKQRKAHAKEKKNLYKEITDLRKENSRFRTKIIKG